MSTELEAGTYVFRAKFINKHDEMEIDYTNHVCYNKLDVSRAVDNLKAYYAKQAKGEVTITYRISEGLYNNGY